MTILLVDFEHYFKRLKIRDNLPDQKLQLLGVSLLSSLRVLQVLLKNKRKEVKRWTSLSSNFDKMLLECLEEGVDMKMR